MGRTRLLPPVPDDVTFPLLPFGAEAAYALPVQEGSLLCQRPHHAVSGCDLGQWVWTVDLYSSGTRTIHTETCRGDRQEAPKTHSQDFAPHLYCAVCCCCCFFFWYSIFLCSKHSVFLRSSQQKIVRSCLNRACI